MAQADKSEHTSSPVTLSINFLPETVIGFIETTCAADSERRRIDLIFILLEKECRRSELQPK